VKRSLVLVVITVALIAGATFALSRDDGPTSGGPATQRFAGTHWFEQSCELPLELLERIERGTVVGRSADITYVPAFPNYFGSFAVSTHSGPWDYLQQVPLVLYGPGYIEGNGDLTLDRPVTLADLAPTLAEVLGTELPGERVGVPLTEALVAPEDRTTPPKLIIVVVWDGSGWNVLDEWPTAWPFLQSLMARGTSIQDVTVGSSPSVTPAVHTTIGTGTFPAQHGIVDIPIRNGNRVPDSFPDKSARFLEIPTLADTFDAEVDNRSKVGMIAERGWHLGMMGHGSLLDGADKDIAVMRQGGEGELSTNEFYYRLPRYMKEVAGMDDDITAVDAFDGKSDGRWMGHLIPPEHRAGAANPVWTRFQARLLETLIRREGFGADDTPDLLFTNFKEIDLIGHVYNMVNPEMRSVLSHSDAVLERLVSFFDSQVGAGEWMLAFTADHGSGPDPRTIDAWPISMPQLQVDVAASVRVRVTKLFQAQRPTGMWFHPPTVAKNEVDLGAVAELLLDYRIEDNLEPDQVIPPQYSSRSKERLFAAAFPTTALPEVMACARERA
jgi:predicted AlkP superfamily pyrophosphatase or phosphodiesterase